MAQTRFIKYKDNLVSDDTNASKSGIIPGAAYRGFDEISGISGLTFNIDHNLTGEVRPDLSEADSPKTGIWVTRQGVTIKEDAPLPFVIETNAGNGSYRNDYIIGRHHHDIIYTGGVVATYGVIKGPLNSDSLPTAVSGNDYVILGTVRIPPNATTAAGSVFKRARTPSLGNKFPAMLDEENRFTDQEQENQAANVTILVATYDTLTNRNYIPLLDKGNLFIAAGTSQLDLLPVKPKGTEILIYFGAAITIKPFISQLKLDGTRAGYTVGLRPIVINYDTVDDLLINGNQVATFRMVDKGGVYNSSTNKVYGDFWKLISVSDTPATLKLFASQLTSLNSSITALSTQVATLSLLIDGLDYPGNIRSQKIYGDISDFFNTTGRGRPDNVFPKHQICNGELTTPDLRDIKLSGFPGSTFDYVTNNDVLGSDNLTLLKTNIPETRPNIHGSQLNKPNDGGTSSNKYIKVLGTDGLAPGNPIDAIYGNGTGDGNADPISLKGARYQVIFIMRLPDDVIAANPYTP